MLAKKPILIGSIIHLKNMLQDDSEGVDGGYLDACGWVTDKPVISNFQDERIRKFVSTHERARRSVGSGSWLVLSADGKKSVGESLVAGDQIHLLNMHPGSGYLDTFEWVNRLIPFEDYFPAMQMGVSTTSTPKRDGGLTGIWTIKLPEDKAMETDKIFEESVIHLENGFSDAQFLYTYGDVKKKPLFHDYDGQQKFVFTSQSESQEGGSRKWRVTLSDLQKHLYHVQNRWGGKHALWHEGGLFKIGDSAQLVVALNVTSDDLGKTLSGTVRYEAEPEEVTFRATHRGQNVYDAEISQPATSQWVADGQWLLGSRKHQKIIAMAIRSDDDDGGALESALNGTITYAGEGPISFRVTRKFMTASYASTLLDDLLHPEWVGGRTNKMESDIVANDKLLFDVFKGISRSSNNDVIQHIYQFESENKKKGYEGLKKLGGETKPGGTPDSFEPLDQDFQIEQLLNLHMFSQLLNSFSRYTLYELMKHSLRNHQNDEDESVAPLHLFRKCFEHIATDHKIIEQAVLQRQWDRDLEDNYLRVSAVELLIMDKLAIKAVAPFQHLLLGQPDQPDDLAVITYLSERTHIHLTPYTKQFIFIGVSYDRVPPAASIFENKDFIGKDLYAFELMAIPHEVGHYIYQHGKLDGKTFRELSEKFEGTPYYRWCEEIFADVYSCIVAGPLAAISMQALLMSIDRTRAWKDDEDHPTPVLRVFIFAEILLRLREIKGAPYEFPNVTNKLDGDWAQILALWGYSSMDQREGRPARVYMHDNSALHLDTIVNVNRVIKAIRPMIEEFATRLLMVAKSGDNEQSNNEENKLSTKIPWSRYDEEKTRLYNVEMARLVNLDFARKKAARQVLLDIKQDDATQSDLSNPDEKLRQYLDSWGDSGPYGWGGH